MVSETPLTDASPSVSSRPRPCDKVRLRFRKGGDLRLVSHRDLMKCFERVLRRACLPVHVTQGFHPMPRMVFAMSLGLGIVGADEVLELEFTEAVEPDEVHRRIAAQLPPGIEILSARRIPVKTSAQVRRAGYRIPIPDERLADLPQRIDALLAAKECWIERTRPAPRRLDLRPFLSDLRLHDQHLEMLLWVTPTGAARPGEVMALLGLGDVAESGVPMERHLLEIHDETHQTGPLPEVPEASGLCPALPLTQGRGTVGSPPDEPRDGAGKVVRPTPLIPGPLNFDS